MHPRHQGRACPALPLHHPSSIIYVPVNRLLAVPSVPRGTSPSPFTPSATRAGLPSHMPTPGKGAERPYPGLLILFPSGEPRTVTLNA
jgi:hypothetical protein